MNDEVLSSLVMWLLAISGGGNVVYAFILCLSCYAFYTLFGYLVKSLDI